MTEKQQKYSRKYQSNASVGTGTPTDHVTTDPVAWESVPPASVGAFSLNPYLLTGHQGPSNFFIRPARVPESRAGPHVVWAAERNSWSTKYRK